MRKVLVIIIAAMIILAGCSGNNTAGNNSNDGVPSIKEQLGVKDQDFEYDEMSDPELLSFVEDAVYSDLIYRLDSDKYFVENVEAKYVSPEYLEELEYNSQENIYFGYTLSELEGKFENDKYIFTLGDDGTTIVKAFEGYDDTFERTVRNVAIGSGVILVCVTVSVVTGGTGAPVVSMVFAASAKTGTAFALSSGVISGAASGIVTGIQTNDVEESLKAAAVSGSEGFKWGAISGATAGGAGELVGLYGASLNGLTMNEAAMIQKESKLPLSIIKQMKSVKEYEVYKKAGLVTQRVNGEMALVRNIDLKYKSDLGGKTVSNLERMKKGYAPIDPATGKAYQLHHIGQKSDGTLAILTEAEHQGNSSILNIAGKESEIDRTAFNEVRKAFWKDFARLLS